MHVRGHVSSPAHSSEDLKEKRRKREEKSHSFEETGQVSEEPEREKQILISPV